MIPNWSRSHFIRVLRDGQKQLTPRKAGEVYGKVITPANPVGRQQRRKEERELRKQLRKETIEEARKRRMASE